MQLDKERKPIDSSLEERERTEDTGLEARPEKSPKRKNKSESDPDSEEDWIFRLSMAVL